MATQTFDNLRQHGLKPFKASQAKRLNSILQYSASTCTDVTVASQILRTAGGFGGGFGHAWPCLKFKAMTMISNDLDWSPLGWIIHTGASWAIWNFDKGRTFKHAKCQETSEKLCRPIKTWKWISQSGQVRTSQFLKFRPTKPCRREIENTACRHLQSKLVLLIIKLIILN